MQAVITGHITDINGTALADIPAEVYDAGGTFVSSAASDDNGTYAVGGLPTGTYRVFFNSFKYAAQWYNGKPDIDSADAVFVTEGQIVNSIDAQLEPLFGSISGRVTDESNAPLVGYRVEVRTLDNFPVSEAQTDNDGNYQIDWLLPGEYKVFFEGRPGLYLDEWSCNEPDFNMACTIFVWANQLSPGVDAQLAAYSTLFGSISGRVTDESNAPLVGYRVEVRTLDNFPVSEAQTDDDGNYQIDWLLPGEYKVFFEGRPGLCLDEWSCNEPDFNMACTIFVWENQLSPGVDAQLAAYNTLFGSISGRVTDESNAPLVGYRVEVRTLDNFPVSETQTDNDGNYQIDWLLPGEYKVFFEGRPGLYLDEWSCNEPDFNMACTIFVWANQLNPGIDAQLAAYSTLFGSISGRVTDESNAPLVGYRVEVRTLDNFPVSEAQTDDDGNYQIDWLLPGEYKVFFEGRPGLYLDEWSCNEPDFNMACTIFVWANQLSPGIDAQLAAYSTLFGSISGRVTDESNAPLAGYHVEVRDVGIPRI